MLLFHKMADKVQIIGLMSGTSKDGLDIALVSFDVAINEYSFDLISYSTVCYPSELLDQLNQIETLSARKIFELDKKIGLFYAQEVNRFIEIYHIDKVNITAIASHGQTIFHQPTLGFSTQIGCGTSLAFHTGIKVINDFRNKDILAGGQGAPLVPIGDDLLFKNTAHSFLNIGGFTNISFKREDKMVAFDISPGNIPLNLMANKYDLEYDHEGKIAKSGVLDEHLLSLFNDLHYYKEKAPKSLGTEWLEAEFLPLMEHYNTASSVMRTLVEHEAIQIAKVLNEENLSSVFVTGGGAKNKFLMERLQYYYTGEIIIPAPEIIDYKEAIIFAFLGLRYLLGKPNTNPQATGARKDVISGVLHMP